MRRKQPIFFECKTFEWEIYFVFLFFSFGWWGNTFQSKNTIAVGSSWIQCFSLACFDDYLHIFLFNEQKYFLPFNRTARKASFATFFKEADLFQFEFGQIWCIRTNENGWFIQWVALFSFLYWMRQTFFRKCTLDDLSARVSLLLICH